MIDFFDASLSLFLVLLRVLSSSPLLYRLHARQHHTPRGRVQAFAGPGRRLRDQGELVERERERKREKFCCPSKSTDSQRSCLEPLARSFLLSLSLSDSNTHTHTPQPAPPPPPPPPSTRNNQPEDLPLLCERHATSKLRDFGGLSNLSSLGFRGEALASLSYVAHLTVTTAVAGAEHALRASYSDGALVGAPQPVAGCRGTTLTIEDLFFNTPSRRRALGSPADEHARCADLVGRYAAHRAGVAFALRKAGAARPDVLTTGIGSASRVNAAGAAPAAASAATSASASASDAAAANPALLPPAPRRASRLDALRAVYGAPLAKSLLPFAFKVGGGGGRGSGGDEGGEKGACGGGGGGGGEGRDASEPAPSFEATGYISAPDWPGRRSAFVLFVNGRCVEAGALKRAAEGAHAAAAPRGAKLFCLVDLRLPPAAVDANVHPTKREVAFLHRDAVAAALADAVDAALRRADRQGRAFVQQLLPGAGAPSAAAAGANAGGGRFQREMATTTTTATNTAATTATEANAATTPRDRAGGDRNLVRVDARARTLDAFVAFRQNGGSAGAGGGSASAAAANESENDEGGGEEGGAPRTAAGAAAAAKAAPSILAAPTRRRGARGDTGSAPSLFAPADPLLSAPAGLPTSSSLAAQAATAAAAAAAATNVFRPRPNPPPSSRLPSVDRLLSAVDAQAHPAIEEALKSAAFVGMTDRVRSLVQSGTSLLLLDLRPLVRDLARQQALRRVNAHATARISAPDGGRELTSVAELIELALLEEKAAEGGQGGNGQGENGDDENGDDKNGNETLPCSSSSPSSSSRIAEAASLASRLLVLKREPLKDHFGIEVTPEGRLAALPEVIDGLPWQPSSLPKLALALARDVDFSSGESRFFETAAEALASCVSLPGWSEEEDEGEDEEEEDEGEEGDDGEEKEQENRNERQRAPAAAAASDFLDRPPTRTLERSVAHVLLPAMRVHLRPPRARSSDGSVVELTRLQSLYKIFERC